jgi:hypothetical protein
MWSSDIDYSGCIQLTDMNGCSQPCDVLQVVDGNSGVDWGVLWGMHAGSFVAFGRRPR